MIKCLELGDHHLQVGKRRMEARMVPGLGPFVVVVVVVIHYYTLKKFLFYIGVQLINNVVLVSGIQQSDSLIHIHVSVLFQILFPFRLLQCTEKSFLCYIVGPCWLSVLNIAVCTCQSQTPNLSLLLTLPSSNQKFVL